MHIRMDVVKMLFDNKSISSNVHYPGVSVANEEDNLSLCGMLAWLGWVVESISVFRRSITVLRERRKGPSPPTL